MFEKPKRQFSTSLGMLITAAAFLRWTPTGTRFAKGLCFHRLPVHGCQDHRFQRTGIVFDRGRFDNHLAIEVAKHPIGSTFCAIDRNNAKVFRSDNLNSLLNRSGGFTHVASFGPLDENKGVRMKTKVSGVIVTAFGQTSHPGASAWTHCRFEGEAACD